MSNDSSMRFERFGTRLSELLAEAEALLEAGADKAGTAEAAAVQALGHAREHLQSAHDAVVGRARKLDRAVHDNPWKAIAATGLIAFLLGLLVRRK